MKFYHGTGADNLDSILKFGFNAVKANKQIWNCSDYNNYFWSTKAILESGEAEEEDQAFEQAKRLAFESAEMGLAKAKDCRRVVFKVDIPEEMVAPDTSCENMEGAVVCEDKIESKYITRYWIDPSDLSYFKAYFGSLIINRDLACEVEFSRVEMAMIEAIKESDAGCIIFETLNDLKSEAVEISVKELTTA